MIWEYKTLSLPSSAERQSMLTEMGLNGWELVGFEQGLSYFKRPIDEPDEVIGAQPEAIAAGLGVPTKVVLEDFSKANYSTQSKRSKKK